MAIEEIRFFHAKKNEPSGVLSNCFERPVVFEGREFRSSEHAYQFLAAKSPALREWIANCPSARLCATTVHKALMIYDFTPGWLPVGDDVPGGAGSRKRNPSALQLQRMRDVVLAKFKQHEDFRCYLLGTGPAVLIEQTPGTGAIDMIWGCGKHCPANVRWDPENPKHGGNWLGRILMETREQLRSSV